MPSGPSMLAGRPILAGLAGLLLAGAVPAPGLAASPRAVPVQVGGDDGDACPGRILRLSPARPGGAVPVRAGPGPGFRVTGRLRDGPRLAVYLCDSAASDRWRGLVYTYGSPRRCRVSSPGPAARGPYRGPCRQGWIRAEEAGSIAD